MDEEHPLNPRSPYAATKAGGDRLAYSYFVTYGLPIVIVRPFNNYGPRQHPEKVVPRFITQALVGRAADDPRRRPREPRLALRRRRRRGDRGDHRRRHRRARRRGRERRDGRRHLGRRHRRRGARGVGEPAPRRSHVDERPGQVDRHIGSTEKLERLTGWRARTSFERGLERTVAWYRENEAWWRAVLASRPRLLVLGAGAGAARAAPRRPRSGSSIVIAVDRDPAAPGFALRRQARRSSPPRTSRRSSGSRGPSASTAIISPGADWPVGDRGPGRRAARPAASDRRRRRPRSSTSKQRQRERFAAAGVPQPRLLDEPTVPCVVKAPDRQGQRGLSLVRREAELPAAIEVALAASRSGALLVEELVDGPEVTVNAVSVDGGFLPLTVTDRLTADPPAFGVALAHAWPSAVSAATKKVLKQHKVRPRSRRARRPRSACATGRPTRRSPRAGRARGGRAGRAARRRPRRRALRGGARGRPERARARLRARRTRLVLFQHKRLSRAARASSSSSRPRASCARSRASRRRTRVDGVHEVRVYREPGRRFGPLRRGADRAGAVLAVGDDRERRARAGSPRRRAQYASSSDDDGETPLGLPAAGGRRGGDRGRRGDAPLRLADDRAPRRAARGADGRVPQAEHVVAVASGTAAMHLALVALGIGPGDEVITTPITWPATANVIVHTGATPVFVDVREGDLNIDPELVAAAVTDADEGDPARPPRRPAVRPRPALRARPAGRRGRGARRRERLPRPQARRALGRRPASRSTRRRTSPRARAGSSRRTAPTSPRRSATCG